MVLCKIGDYKIIRGGIEMKKKMLLITIGILSFMGLNNTFPKIVNANSNPAIKALDSNAPLYLNLFNENNFKNQQNDLNWHYSHSSHGSHGSHSSHSSHYSSRY